MATPPPSAELDLSSVRRDLDLPSSVPTDVEAEAAAAVDRLATERRDATDLDMVTVDPPGAMDLDQALHIAPRGSGGWTVSYAIADVAALVVPGGAVDRESRRRGETLYLPDSKIPVHPAALSEGSGSLLPGVTRPAVLWTIDIDADGEQTDVGLERVTIRSRSRHTYADMQIALDARSAPEAIAELPALGGVRVARARATGAIELGLPSQEVERRPDGTWTIVLRAPLPIETWNAQVSLLTGMAAASLMIEAGVGLLRTLPSPPPEVVDRVRAAAPALGVRWPEGAAAGEVLSTCDARQPRHAAFLDFAAQMLRGAGYLAFDGEVPAATGHAGVGSPYAHVTAPLRRLADRFATEVCLSVVAGVAVPEWARSALPDLPGIMAESSRRARAVDRASIDHVEAWLLAGEVGRTFDVAVVDHAEQGDGAVVALDDPAVRAPCDGRPPLGERITARLVEADLSTRSVRFTPAEHPRS